MAILEHEITAKPIGEQVREIADRFFGSIEDASETKNAPVFVAYFMLDDPDHNAVHRELIKGVVDLSEHPFSTCTAKQGAANLDNSCLESGAIIECSFSGNQLVRSVQADSLNRPFAACYWVARPDQALPY